MNAIPLSPGDLAFGAVLILLLAGLSIALRLNLARQILIAAARTTVQLLLIGLVLKWLFQNGSPATIGLTALVMLTAAGFEADRRQERRLRGGWGFGVGLAAMLLSSFTLTLLALQAIIGVEPWYSPQYAIPLLGMVLGNTMTGVSLGLDRLLEAAHRERPAIEARLMLGQPWPTAMAEIQRQSIRAGMIPILNAMSAAGLVSLPGMMTGQMLAGAPPLEAVQYQILIMFLVAGGTGLGTIAAVWLGARRLFDHRHRLRLERMTSPRDRA